VVEAVRFVAARVFAGGGSGRLKIAMLLAVIATSSQPFAYRKTAGELHGSLRKYCAHERSPERCALRPWTYDLLRRRFAGGDQASTSDGATADLDEKLALNNRGHQRCSRSVSFLTARN
jgi:hypothetical protein